MIEEVLQAVRDWYVAAVPDLTGDRIIPVDDKGPRPQTPYATVSVRGDEAVSDEVREHANGWQAHPIRRYTVEVTVYGRLGEDWHLYAQSYASVVPLTDVSLERVVTAGQYIPDILDTAREGRRLAVYTVLAEADMLPVTVTEADYAVITATITSTAGDDWTDVVYAPEEPEPEPEP